MNQEQFDLFMERTKRNQEQISRILAYLSFNTKDLSSYRSFEANAILKNFKCDQFEPESSPIAFLYFFEARSHL